MEKNSNFYIFIILYVLLLFLVTTLSNSNTKIEGEILESKVNAIGVLDKNNYGIVTFNIYLVPKNKMNLTSNVLIDIDNVSLGNTFQDYLKNTLYCLNNITHGKLKNYTIIIKGKSKFQDVDGGSGSIMLALGILNALYNKTIDDKIIATGTINRDCSIGSVLGVKEKLFGVEKLGYKVFYVPYQNYKLLNTSYNDSIVNVIPIKNFKELVKNDA